MAKNEYQWTLPTMKAGSLGQVIGLVAGLHEGETLAEYGGSKVKVTDLSHLADTAGDYLLDPEMVLTTEQEDALHVIYGLGSKLRGN